jgi:hypothetical protein
MNRWKLSAIHLAISFLLAASIFTVLYFLWFPSPYFVAAGASKLIMVLMGVDVGIGPLLTWIAASPGKSRRLFKLDLSIIAALQTIAFAYGVHAIASARPVFVVAEVDRFVLVSARDLTDADLAQGRQPQFRTRSWNGPVLVGVQPPTSNESVEIAEKVLAGGKDLDQMPRFYVPYSEVVEKLMRRARPVTQLKNVTNAQRKQLEELRQEAKGVPLLMLPLQRGAYDYTVILSPATRRPMSVLSIDPW